MSNNYKTGFIGAGVMGKAIINGLVESNFLDKNNIFASEISRENAEKASQELGIKVFTDNGELVKNSDTVILCTKPYVINTVLEDIKEVLTAKKLIISIAAGVSTGFIESIAGDVPVIRAMPNTPALIKEGMTAICRGRFATDEHVKFAQALFSSVGRCLEVEEKHINAVTGISGSGPAFMYLIIEALADGGVKLGLPKKIAVELAAQTALGAAGMVLETGKHPSILKDEVTTPGGCTIAGLAVMEECNVRASLSKTVQETARTAAGLGK